MLASLWEMDGALIIYDAATLEGSEAPADEQAGRQVQRVEQDQQVGGDEPLIWAVRIMG